MSLQMRVGLGQFNELTDEKLAFYQADGFADDFPDETPLGFLATSNGEYDDLAALKKRADDAELRLMALENVPTSFYDKIMLGQSGREEQLQHMLNTVHNMGKAGIPILGYHWVPNSVWRTPEPATLRGGARATRFALAEHDPEELTHGRVFTHEEMWENYCWYLERILPVAEEADVRLALHPDDPPTGTTLGGIARICSSFDDFKRNMDTFDSPHHGLDFCMGCWSEMGGHDNVIRAVRHFGGQKKIIYIHFRDVIGAGGGLPRDLHRLRSSRYLRGGQDAQGGRFRRLYDHRSRAPCCR